MRIETEAEISGYKRTISGNVEYADVFGHVSACVDDYGAEVLPRLEPDDDDGYRAACAALIAEFMRLAASVYMAELGARGGSAKSEAKARAVRENGKKGGRPKKTKE